LGYKGAGQSRAIPAQIEGSHGQANIRRRGQDRTVAVTGEVRG
jgi:hypothetical protein